MRRPSAPSAPVVIKIGSSSLVGKSGVDADGLEAGVAQVAGLWAAGTPTVLVSSGAVSFGIQRLGWERRPTEIVDLQVAASVGQGRLMERYAAAFAARGIIVGQVLLTKAVLSDREQYLHARHALQAMLARRIVPIVNENDTVAVEELRIGDNDRLAALVSHLVGAGLLVILTDTPGLLSGDPRLGHDVELLSAVTHTDDVLDSLVEDSPGPHGSGGVTTKIAAARMAAWSGVPTIIAPAADPSAVKRAVSGEDVGTWVEPHTRKLPARKLWIAFGQPSSGRVRIDEGAIDAIVKRGRSLLSVGVIDVEGRFGPGSAVEVIDGGGSVVAKGMTRLSSTEIADAAGRRSDDLVNIGSRGGEIIHRDDLVILVARTGRVET